MNVSDVLESYFGPAAERLGQAAGLDAREAERVLQVGVPLQLDALADLARTPEGQAQIAEALANIPIFSSVEAALNEPDGVSHLQQAGELLAPALLGERANSIAAQVAGQADPGGVQQQLHMTLPLLLSFLGQRGLSAAQIGSILPDLKGRLGTAGTAGGALTAASLVDFLKAQFGGQTADRLGKAAGFTGGTAARAAQAAWPIVLNALANKGHTEAGAAELLTRTRDLQRLTHPDGTLNTALLNDPAETARLEGQGRGLLAALFPNVDAVTGRFGSAVGGSGTSAGRLLALTAPLVLALVLSRTRAASLNAGDLSALLVEVRPLLPGVLPAGLTSLGALLVPAPQVETVAAAVSPPPRITQTPPAPDRTAAPPPPPPAATPAPAPSVRRGGFLWWLVPLLLLLGLGGCWFLRQPNTTNPSTTTGVTSNGIAVTDPASGATLPAEDFVMSGTAPAGETLSVEDQGQQVVSVKVGPDGRWQVAVPAPTPGEHTYTVSGQNGARSEVRVNVTGGDNTNNTSNATTGGAPFADGFTITEPAAGAQLPAGGFTLRGTGTPGQTVQVLEDDTSLGNVTVAADGTWSLNVPAPAAGAHTYTLQGTDGTQLASVAATVAAPEANASAVACTQAYTLSITNGQTVSQPFRFGGVGQGEGYRVTVKRGDRIVGTKNVPLDATCGWSYQSRPGAGTVTYEVRPLGQAEAAPLSTVTLTVTP